MLTLVSPFFRFNLCGLEASFGHDPVTSYQLTVLYKLRRADPGFLSAHSHLSPCLPPHNHVHPSFEHDQVHLSLPSFAQSKFKTSERKPASGIALLSGGSSALRWQEGDVDRVDGYGRGNCDEYVHQDIKNRVSVDFEVFMKSILHVPQDWRIRWSQAIEAIRTDPKFKQYHEE